MRVLVVLHHPTFGGPHNQVLRLSAPLRRLGVELEVALTDEPGNAQGRLAAEGVSVHLIRLRRLRATTSPRVQLRFLYSYIADVQRLRALIREREYDAVILPGLVNVQGALAARLEGVPLIWQLVDTRAPAPLRWVISKLVWTLSDAVMSTGRAVASLHFGRRPTDDKLVTFFPPVDVESFRPEARIRDSARAQLGLRSADFVVGTIGNINPQKGHRHFVRAAAELSRRSGDARFVILGATYPNHREYADSVVSLARELGLGPDRMLIRDPQGPVARLAQALDIFWMTSEPRSEGVPTVIGEAMALGIPVVTTDVGSVREIGLADLDLVVTQAGDVNAIVDATLRLRTTLGAGRRAALRERSRALFGLETVTAAHVAALTLAQQRFFRSPLRSVDSATPELLRLLVCPTCRATLTFRATGVVCEDGHRFSVIDGIPVLIGDPERAEHDELRHSHESHRRAQAEYFDDDSTAAYEIARPRRSSALYALQIAEKIRRSLASFGEDLRGRTVVAVCAGSGMDAEYLARRGASVISLDISLGACKRAAERGRRYGFPLLPVVADVEALPFANGSMDIAYVHDGLHHLEDPSKGLHEMARIAKLGISINEPAQAAVTSAAVSFGLALAHEESGNRVQRVNLQTVTGILSADQLRVDYAARYFCYYRHRPGWLSRLLSLPGLLFAAEVTTEFINRLAGRFGNKSTIQASRVLDGAGRRAAPSTPISTTGATNRPIANVSTERLDHQT